MSAETTNIIASISDDMDPMIQEFVSRTLNENIVDLYVEYYNRGVDLEYQTVSDAKEKARLKLIVAQCEQMIISKALAANGYDARMMIKYVKKRKQAVVEVGRAADHR